MAAIAMIFASVWFLVYYCNMIIYILEATTETVTYDELLVFTRNYDYFGVGLMIFFLLMCFNPFDCFKRPARKELGWTIL